VPAFPAWGRHWPGVASLAVCSRPRPRRPLRQRPAWPARSTARVLGAGAWPAGTPGRGQRPRGERAGDHVASWHRQRRQPPHRPAGSLSCGLRLMSTAFCCSRGLGRPPRLRRRPGTPPPWSGSGARPGLASLTELSHRRGGDPDPPACQPSRLGLLKAANYKETPAMNDPAQRSLTSRPPPPGCSHGDPSSPTPKPSRRRLESVSTCARAAAGSSRGTCGQG